MGREEDGAAQNRLGLGETVLFRQAVCEVDQDAGAVGREPDGTGEILGRGGEIVARLVGRGAGQPGLHHRWVVAQHGGGFLDGAIQVAGGKQGLGQVGAQLG